MSHTSFSLPAALALGAAGLFTLSACQGEGPAPEAGGSLAGALCSAERPCEGDSTGGYVESVGPSALGAERAPACACGAAKQESASALGITCAAAYNLAKQQALAQSDCPDRVCSSSFVSKTCSPVSGNRDDGFEADVVVSYTCKEPANCE